MTNQEKYKAAFSVLHTSTDFSMEVKRMEQMKTKRHAKRLVASIAACLVIMGSATAAYAADLGGMQRTLQLWFHGDQTEVTVEFTDDGSYSATYTDKDGNEKHRGGGGVAFLPDGTERPLTPEELMDELTAPEVEYRDDGSVWLYWFDQVVEITDKFENDVCYVKLVHNDQPLYMTIKYQGGYATSPRKYISPLEFRGA